MKKKIVIDNERARSWNGYYSGKHWATRKKEVDRIHLLVREQIDPNDVFMFEGPVRITVTAYVPDNPLDSDNVAAKPFIDGLIGWWFVDDSLEYVVSTTTMCILDPDSPPRIEIEAEEVMV